MERCCLSPGTYLIKGSNIPEDMAGNLSGSELLGACGKFVEGISEVPRDCCCHCHRLQSNSVLADMDTPLDPLTSREQGFQESSFHCNWEIFLLHSPWVPPKLLHIGVQCTSTIQMAHRDIWRLVLTSGSPTFSIVLNVSFLCHH